MNYTRESFERTQPLHQTASALPAAAYNLTRILLADSPTGSVFVPVRTLQYLAVIDPEEIIFVDGQYKRWVEVAWQGFRPQARQALDEPVAYQALFYTPDGMALQRRLQTEFPPALRQLAARRPTAPCRLLPFRR